MVGSFLQPEASGAEFKRMSAYIVAHSLALHLVVSHDNRLLFDLPV